MNPMKNIFRMAMVAFAAVRGYDGCCLYGW